MFKHLYFLFLLSVGFNQGVEGTQSLSSLGTPVEKEDNPSIYSLEDSGLSVVYEDEALQRYTAILRRDENGESSRYFYFYNDQGNLEKVIVDNGQGQQPPDLTGVTQRQIVSLQVGEEGKPLKIENTSWESDLPDANGTLENEVLFHYDSQGELMSIEENGEKIETLLLDEKSQKFYYSFSLGGVWGRIVDSFFAFVQYLQFSSHQTKTKWNAELNLPTPAALALERIGKILFGESTYLLMGPHYEETQVGCYGQHEISDKVRVTFINGILNTRNMMLKSLDIISESHGGVKVHYVFRPTEGWTWDITRAILIRTAFTLGFRSLHAYLLAKMWREIIEEIGGVDGGGVIVHYAHSLGGSETDRARELLTPEEQKMIRVVTLGSSTMIRNVGFQSVINIVSVNDGVSSCILEPSGRMRNYFDPETNVRFYSSLSKPPYWPADHFLNGPTYGSILRELGEKFLMEFTPHFEEMDLSHSIETETKMAF